MSEKAQKSTHKDPASQPAGPDRTPLPESPAGYPILALQRAVGNRAVQRLIRQGEARASGPARIQRSPLRPDAVQGVELGSLIVIATDEPIPMRAAGELVQAGDTPGRFQGFGSLYQALSLSLLQSGVTAIVRDPDGLYHVLEVTESTAPGEATTSEPRRGVPGFEVIRFVNPAIPTPAGVIYGEAPLREQDTWAGRVEQAQDLRERYYGAGQRGLRDQLAAAFRSLAADAFNVAPSEIHILFSSDQAIPPNGISIMLDQGMQSHGVSGTTRPPPPPGESRPPLEMTPSEPASGQQPTMWISADLFDPSGPERVRAVLRHEATHGGITERVGQLMDIWQQGGRPEGDFWLWLRREQRLPGGGEHHVTVADLQMAMSRLFAASDEPATCVARFTAEYHLVPSDQLVSPERVDPHTFDELQYMLANWVAAGGGMPGGGVPPLRDEAMRRLRAYYGQLDEPHRAAFDRWVDRLPGAENASPIMAPTGAQGHFASWSDESVQAAIGQMRAFREGARGPRRRRPPGG